MRLLVSPEEAAEILDRTPRTIRNWIADGVLEAAPRVGRKHSIYVRSIAELAGLSIEEVTKALDSIDERKAREALERRKQRIINKPGAFVKVSI